MRRLCARSRRQCAGVNALPAGGGWGPGNSPGARGCVEKCAGVRSDRCTALCTDCVHRRYTRLRSHGWRKAALFIQRTVEAKSSGRVRCLLGFPRRPVCVRRRGTPACLRRGPQRSLTRRLFIALTRAWQKHTPDLWRHPADGHETIHRESERRRNVRRLSVSSRPLSDRVSPIDGVAMASNLSRAV